jgi:hypothetical protein
VLGGSPRRALESLLCGCWVEDLLVELAGGLFFGRGEAFEEGPGRASEGLLGVFGDEAFGGCPGRASEGSLSVFGGERLLAFLAGWLDLLSFRRPFRGFDSKSLPGSGVFVLLWFAL